MECYICNKGIPFMPRFAGECWQKASPHYWNCCLSVTNKKNRKLTISKVSGSKKCICTTECISWWKDFRDSKQKFKNVITKLLETHLHSQLSMTCTHTIHYKINSMNDQWSQWRIIKCILKLNSLKIQICWHIQLINYCMHYIRSVLNIWKMVSWRKVLWHSYQVIRNMIMNKFKNSTSVYLKQYLKMYAQA